MHTPPAPCQEPGRTCCACTPYQDLAISIVKLAVNLFLQFYQNLFYANQTFLSKYFATNSAFRPFIQIMSVSPFHDV